MTLDEAIKHEEECMIENLEKTMNRNSSDPIAIQCFECADEHRQLAEWLKDYKQLLEQTQGIKDAIAEIEQLNENDYPQMDRTITKFKDIVLEIIYKHIKACDTE